LIRLRDNTMHLSLLIPIAIAGAQGVRRKQIQWIGKE
jgi:hypothetical protein